MRVIFIDRFRLYLKNLKGREKMKENFKGFLALMFLLLVFTAPILTNYVLNHAHYQTISENDGVVLITQHDAAKYVPKGAYIIGSAYEMVDRDGRGLIKNGFVPEGKINQEYLVTTDECAVIYFSSDQEDEANKLLSSK